MNDWLPGPIPRRTQLLRRFARNSLPVRQKDDVEILEQAARAYPDLTFEDLDRRTLLAVQKERGSDFATALFYDRAKRARPEPREFPEVQVREVLVVPSALYLHYPEFSGDGEIFRSIAKAYGLPARLAPVVSVGSTRENAEIIRDQLATSADRSVLVATVSKGAADFRHALDLYPEIKSKVAGWVTASGIIHGTYVCNRMLEARGLKRLLISINFWFHHGTWDFSRSIYAGPGAPLDRKMLASELPFPVACVVGCPMRQHLTPYTRIRHGYLLKNGPNDGSTLLADAYVEGGRIFPIWGADHFLFSAESALAIRKAFASVAQKRALALGHLLEV